MHITFIRPNMYKGQAADAMQPLVFSVLAALTPPDVRIDFYDDRLEELPLDLTTDAVVLSVETFTAKRAYQIAQAYRQRKIPVLMGGFHPTFMPEEALQYADSVVIGDGETAWPQILDDLRHGKLQSRYQWECLPNLAGVHYDRSIFQGKKYLPLYPVQYGRGCRYACDFCSISAFYGKNLRQRPIAEIVAEIKTLKAKNIFLIDDNIFCEVDKAKELFTALIPLKIRWACQGSIDLTDNDELLSLMQRSGCMNLLIGFESLDQRNLALMNKTANVRRPDYAEVVRKIKSYGIMIYGTFVFGYDYDTIHSFEEAVDFALEQKLCLANFNPLMPMPGTKLYERLLQEGRMLHEKWWLDPNFKYGDAMFIPRNMTPEELTTGCKQARLRFNTYANILKRALDFQANWHSWGNIGIYLAANLVSRHEILSKQGSYLGG